MFSCVHACLSDRLCVWHVWASPILHHVVRSKWGAGAGRSQDEVLRAEHSWVMCEPSSTAVIGTSLGCTVADWWPHTGALKPTVQKAGRIWTAHTTSHFTFHMKLHFKYDARWLGSGNKINLYTQISSVISTTSRNHKWRNQMIVHEGKNNNKGLLQNTWSFSPLCGWVSCILWACVWNCNKKKTVKCNTYLNKR